MLPFLKTTWHQSPAIRLAVYWNIALAAIALIGLFTDHRSILGLNPWIKPLKFDLSVILFLLTIAAFLSALGTRFPQQSTLIAWGVSIALIFENSVISLQSFRGVRSHMNFTTPLDATLFSLMGIFIAINTLFVVWLLVLFCVTPTTWPTAAAWGARLGLLALLAGSIEGVLMVSHGSHTVGAPDGLPGLTFVNWSTTHGDLRVAHFFALHALQLLPLLGYALSRTPIPQKLQITTLVISSACYFAIVWFLFKQAMAARPVIPT
jgi:hypothetical protein